MFASRSVGPCYTVPSPLQLPWWLSDHGNASSLCQNEPLWRITHGSVRLVGSGGRGALASLRACEEGPAPEDAAVEGCLKEQRLFMCVRSPDGAPGGSGVCLDKELAVTWCGGSREGQREGGLALCSRMSLVAAMLASAAVSLANFGTRAAVPALGRRGAIADITLGHGAVESLQRNISEDVAAVGGEVGALYEAILRRDADAGGRHTYVTNMVTGRMTLADVARVLRDSPEFHEHVVANRIPRSGARSVREELLRALAVLIALSPGCRPSREEPLEKILDGSVPTPPLLCADARGVPAHLYRRLTAMYMSKAGGSWDPVSVAKVPVDMRVLNAAQVVDAAFKEHLGRWAGQADMAQRVTRVLDHSLTAKSLGEELRSSGEHRQLVSNTAPVTGSSAKLAAAAALLRRLLAEHVCAPGQSRPRDACAHAAATPVHELQRLWNVHAPVLLANGRTTEDFAAVRDGLTGFVPVGMYVYNRPHYVQQVLANLRAARGVGNVLLVVSLDAATEDMVSRVLAAREYVGGLRLLFHPYPSRPLGPVGGRGADGVLVVKNHWRFVLRQIWEELTDLRGYDGEVLLLEEDHAPTPDVLETLRALVRLKNGGLVSRGLPRGEEEGTEGLVGRGGCEGCWGVYLKFGCMEEGKETDIHKACRVKWFVNTGLAFNRSIYEAIAASDFDSFRDGWDWSIYHLIQTQQLLACQSATHEPRCIPHMVAPAVSRIANIGAAGGVTVHADDAASQEQLHYGTVGANIYAPSRGFSARRIALAPYFGHGGPTDEGLYFGFEEKHLQW